MKRMTALLLAVIMVVGMIPTVSLAADTAPRNVHWSTGTAYLMGTWDPPSGDSHEGYDYDVAVYYSPNGVDNWKSLGYYYVTTYSFSPGAMTVDPSYVGMYGDGYYKFAVACSSLSVNGESEWAESDIYHLDSGELKNRIAAPVSGAFGNNYDLSWTDPEGIDPGFYEHSAIVEMYYIGDYEELPMSQWKLVKRESVGSTNAIDLHDFLYESELKKLDQGMYIFYVSNLADDYCSRGLSERLQLDGFYYHVREDDGGSDAPVGTALPTPTNLEWTEMGTRWDNPYDLGYDIDNYSAYSIQLLRSTSADTDPADAQVIHTEDMGVSAEMLMVPEYFTACQMEIGEMMRAIAMEYGSGYYWLRVQAIPEDTTKNSASAWAYSSEMSEGTGGTMSSAGEATNLTWNVVHMNDGTTKTMPGTISFYIAEESTRFALKVYRMDEYGFEEQVGSNEGWLGKGWFHWDMFIGEESRCKTGRYYYTIQLLGDGETTSEGPVVTSEIWNYTRPDKVLTATNLAWDTDNMQLDFDLDTAYAAGLWVEYYFNGTEDNAEEADYLDSYTYEIDALPISIPQNLFSRQGEGWYYYKVYGTPADMTEAVSVWSALSPAYHYEKPDFKLNITSVGWDGQYLVWDGAFDKDLVDYYEVRYYYGETEDTIDYENFINYQSYDPQALPVKMPGYLLRNHGEGFYTYAVRAYSNNPVAALDGDWSAHSAPYHHEVASEKAPAPYDLQWHYARYWEDDAEYIPGVISFAVDVPESIESLDYRIDLYRRAENATESDELVGDMWAMAWANDNSYATVEPFSEFPEQMTSGTYYFTVTAIGDGVTVQNSETVVSADWTYTRPATVLQVSDPAWTADKAMAWTFTGDEDLVGSYQVRIQWVPNGSTFNENSWDSVVEYGVNDRAVLPSYMLQNWGAGTFYFKVCAVADDITAAASSEWTEWSEGMYIEAPDTTLKVCDLQWGENGAMNFDFAEGSAWMVDTYRIRIYYGTEATGYDDLIGNFHYAQGDDLVMPEWILEEYGPGYYWFKVMPYSNNAAVALDGDWSELSPAYELKGPETKAAQATELQWNVRRSNNGSSNEVPGVVSFKNPCHDGSTRTEFRIDFYRVTEDGAEFVDWSNIRTRNPYISISPFESFPELMTTGTYCFTVTTKGDRINTADSDPVQSGTWFYQRPAKQLEVSDPVWNTDMSMDWDNGDVEADYYEVRFQFVEKGGKFYPDEWNDSASYWAGDPRIAPEWLISEYGEGTYYFKVRGMSERINEICASDWTDWSAGFTYAEPSIVLTPTNIIWDEITREINWSVSAPAYVDRYEVALLYGETEKQMETVDWFGFDANMLPWSFPQRVWEDYGPGYYSFIVYAYSNNPMMAASGEAEYDGVLYHKGVEADALPPTDLLWGVERWNEETGNSIPGVLSFANPYFDNGETDAEFMTHVYRRDANGDVMVAKFNTSTSNPYVTLKPFERANQKMVSGDYYFTVYTVGDGITLNNSALVTSATWTYNRPAAELTVSNPVWNDDMTMSWTTGNYKPDYYRFRFQYVGENETFNPQNSHGAMTWRSSTGAPAVPEWLLEDYGAGTYYFQVQAHSDDVTDVAPSNWSTWSAGYEYGSETPDVPEQPELPLAPQVTDLQWVEGQKGVISFTDTEVPEGALKLQYLVVLQRRKADGNGTQVDYRWIDHKAGEPVSTRTVDFSDKVEAGETYYVEVFTGAYADVCRESEVVLSADWTYSLPKAPQATDLAWNIMRDDNGGSAAHPGMMSFVAPQYGSDVRYRILTYRQEATGDVVIANVNVGVRDSFFNYSIFQNDPELMTTGTYYFEVITVGDGVNTLDSDPVRSATWFYQRPAVQLEVSDPVWLEDMTMSWTNGTAQADYYEVRYQHVAEGESFEYKNWDDSLTFWPGDECKLDQWTLEAYGEGTWYFKVRAISNRIDQVRSSNWSDWSEAYYYDSTDTPEQPVASVTVGGTTTNYTDFASALTAAQNASGTVTLTLLADVEGSGTISGGTFTLDLNGHSITTTSGAALTVNSGTVIITDSGEGGSISGYYGVSVYNSGKATIEGGTVIGNNYGVYVYSGKLAISGGIIRGTLGVYVAGSNAAVTISGGTITGSNNSGVSVYNNCEVTITGGSISGYYYGVFAYTDSEATISGGTISGNHGVYVYGKATITGGTITGNSNGVYVNGGDVAICGGSFSHDPSNYVVDGYEAVWNTAIGLYDVVRAEPELSIPSNPVWVNDMMMNWDYVGVTPTEYQIEIQHVVGDEEPDDNGGIFILHWDDSTPAQLPAWLIEQYGEGSYYFRVRAALKDDNGMETTSDWSDWSEGYVYGAQEELTPMPAATELTWDIEHLVWGGTKANTGTIGFHGPRNADYEVKIYRNTANGPELLHTENDELWNGEYGNVFYFPWNADNCQTGTYFFTVQLKGDGINTCDGPVVTSDTWSYVRPTRVLTAENLQWDVVNNHILWDGDVELVDQVSVNYYYNAEKDDPGAAWNYGMQNLDDESVSKVVEINEYMLTRGPGWYYFTITLRSNDIGVALGGTTSVMSAAYCIPGAETPDTSDQPKAEAVGNTVQLSANLPEVGVSTTYMAGVYSADGQMLGMITFQPETTKTLEIKLDTKVPAGAYVRIFAVDTGAGWTAPVEPIEIFLK